MIYDPKQRKDSVIRQVQNQFAGAGMCRQPVLPPPAPPLSRRSGGGSAGTPKPKGIFTYTVTDAENWQDDSHRQEYLRLRLLRGRLQRLAYFKTTETAQLGEALVQEILERDPEEYLVLLEWSPARTHEYIQKILKSRPGRKSRPVIGLSFQRTFRKPQIDGKVFLLEGKYYRIINKAA